jgi:hypothetical protein
VGWLVALSCVAAFLFGLWLGLPRRYDQPFDELDRRLDEEGEHQRVKRHTTFLSLLQRKVEKGSARRQRPTRRPFQMK